MRAGWLCCVLPINVNLNLNLNLKVCINVSVFCSSLSLKSLFFSLMFSLLLIMAMMIPPIDAVVTPSYHPDNDYSDGNSPSIDSNSSHSQHPSCPFNSSNAILLNATASTWLNSRPSAEHLNYGDSPYLNLTEDGDGKGYILLTFFLPDLHAGSCFSRVALILTPVNNVHGPPPDLSVLKIDSHSWDEQSVTFANYFQNQTSDTLSQGEEVDYHKVYLSNNVSQVFFLPLRERPIDEDEISFMVFKRANNDTQDISFWSSRTAELGPQVFLNFAFCSPHARCTQKGCECLEGYIGDGLVCLSPEELEPTKDGLGGDNDSNYPIFYDDPGSLQSKGSPGIDYGSSNSLEGSDDDNLTYDGSGYDYGQNSSCDSFSVCGPFSICDANETSWNCTCAFGSGSEFTCLNGGLCFYDDGNLFCLCPMGFYGAYCEDVIYCESTNYDEAFYEATPVDSYALGVCLENTTGNPIRYCNISDNGKGVWDPPVGKCSPLFCPATTSSSVNFPKTPVNQTVSSKCKVNYVSSGFPTRPCYLNGTWGPITHSCFQARCPQEIYMNARWNLTLAGTNISYGICLSDYTGNPSRACLSNGDWSNQMSDPCINNSQVSPVSSVAGGKEDDEQMTQVTIIATTVGILTPLVLVSALSFYMLFKRYNQKNCQGAPPQMEAVSNGNILELNMIEPTGSENPFRLSISQGINPIPENSASIDLSIPLRQQLKMTDISLQYLIYPKPLPANLPTVGRNVPPVQVDFQGVQSEGIGDKGKQRGETERGNGGVLPIVESIFLAKNNKSASGKLKVFLPEYVMAKRSRDEDPERFRKEVRVMSQLASYPNVAYLLSFTESPYYILTPYYELSLSDLIHNYDKQYDSLDVADMLYHILDGMTAIHGHGIAHRELQPSNIFLEPRSKFAAQSQNQYQIATLGEWSDFPFRIKIGIFGGCMVNNSEDSSPKNVLVNLSDFNFVYRYAAPELYSLMDTGSVHGSINDFQTADLYAFAMTLWELIHRSLPWRGLTSLQIQDYVEDGIRPSILARDERDSKLIFFISLIGLCWSHDPSKRPRFANSRGQLKTVMDLEKTPYIRTSFVYHG